MPKKRLLSLFLVLILLGVGYWQRNRLWTPRETQQQISLKEQVRHATARTVTYLVQSQAPDGHWEGEVMYNATSTAALILLRQQLDREAPLWTEKALDWMERHQNPDGSWGVVLAPSLSDAQATALALLALEEHGRSNSEAARRARAWLEENGGVQRAGLLAQVFYALYGKYAWEDVPLLPVEALLTEEGQAQLYEGKGIWNRDVLPAAMILKSLALPVQEPTRPSPVPSGTMHPVFTPTPPAGPTPFPPGPSGTPTPPPSNAPLSPQILRQQALEQAAQILVQNQWQDGSWGGTTMATFLAVLALHQLDAQTYDQAIQSGLAYLEDLTHEEGYVERFRLPVWDTALTVLALCRPSYVQQPEVQEACKRAERWLLQAQSAEGGWSFVANPGSASFSDSDDTALALAALTRFPEDAEVHEAVDKGLRFLLARQNEDGGWAAFAHNVDEKEPGPLPPYFRDPGVIFQDPSTADVTGHVLYAFGRIQSAMPWLIDDEVLQAAQRVRTFLYQDQMDDGKWYGRWGICYIYGTGVVLQGLKEAGPLGDFPERTRSRAVDWLKKVQHSDGGWGEWYLAFFDEQWAGIGFSTPGQTAFALLGLQGDLPATSEEKAVTFLVNTQQEDGTWPSDVLLSGISVYYDSHFASIMPFWALSEYRESFTP